MNRLYVGREPDDADRRQRGSSAAGAGERGASRSRRRWLRQILKRRERRQRQRQAAPAWIAKWIAECAKDLMANAGKSLVVAGHRQPLAVHLLAHAINAALGQRRQDGRVSSKRRTSHEGSIAELGAGAERRPGRDARDPGRQPGLQRAGGFELGDDAAQGEDGRAAGLLRRRNRSRTATGISRWRIISNRGATRAPATARWCRFSR